MKFPPTVVLYHDISDGTNPLFDHLGVSTHPENFEKHLRYFCRNYDIINVADLINGTLPRRPLLITFDDAYRSVSDTAGPILNEQNAPSLFFINPAPIIDKMIPIDNLICLAANTNGFESTQMLIDPNDGSPPTITHLIGTLLPKLDLTARNKLKDTLLNALSTTHEKLISENSIYLTKSNFATLPEIHMDVGNHTYSHAHLRILTEAEHAHEIGESKKVLERLSNTVVNTLSVPYGDSIDAPPSILKSVRESGHALTFLVHERLNCLRLSPDVYFRTSLHNESPSQLPMKLQVLPLLRTVKSKLKRQ